MTPTETMKRFWPDWRIDREIGRGAFGRVYHAVREENGLSDEAAVKIMEIPADASGMEALYSEGFDENSAREYLKNIIKELLAEIRLMVSLKGAPNIVIIEDYKVVEKADSVGWIIYIRMELLTPFTSYSAAHVLNEAETVRLGMDICRALSVCAEENIIHRDVKPQNIFIDRFGNFKLGDFGIARRMENATETMSRKGTFNYMAPEVNLQAAYDQRVDIYSLGILLYQLCNGGMLPFIRTQEQLTNPEERVRALQRRLGGEKLPAPRDASKDLAAIILKATAYEPSERYATAADMLADLKKLAESPDLYDSPEVYSREEGRTEKIPEKETAQPPVLPADKTFIGGKTSDAGPVPGETAGGIRLDESAAVPRDSGAKAKSNGRKRAAPEKPKKKMGKAWMWIAAAVLLVAAAVLALLWRIQPIVMPDVAGKTGEDAVRILRDEHLTVETEYVFSDEVPEGVVIRQNIPPDEQVGKGKDIVLTVSGGADGVERITIAGGPDRVEYYVGELLDTDNLTLEAAYRSGKTETVTEGFECTPRELNEAGNREITVSYEGKTATFAVTVKDPAVTSLTVKSNPAKTGYFTGDPLDPSGLTLTAVYEDGKSETVTDGFTCSPEVLEKEGTQSIAVAWGGKTAAFDVTVKDPAVTSLTVKSNPAKTGYFTGDPLDRTGLTLTAIYENGKSETVTEGFSCSPEVLEKEGTQSIAVAWGGKTAAFDVTVKDPAVTSLTVKSNPAVMNYFSGDPLDRTGLTLTAVYENGKTETVTDGFTCLPVSFGAAGKQTVTVTYKGSSTAFDVNVAAVTLKSVVVKTGPAKANYFVGDKLDQTGLTLTATYSNGKTETVTSGFTCSPDSFGAAGKQTVTVTYKGRNTAFDVNVAAVTLKSVAVKTGPAKANYFVGDKLDQTGLTLTATYNNGKTETVTSGFTCWPTSLGTAGTQTVTVTYNGKKTTLDVSVSAVTLSSIAVKTNPTKTNYYVGDTLAQSGLTLTATYNNGKTETVTSGFTCFPNSFWNAGKQTVTVTYNGKKTTFGVTVDLLPKAAGVSIISEVAEFDTLEIPRVALHADIPPEASDIQWSFSDITPSVIAFIGVYEDDKGPYDPEISYVVVNGSSFFGIRKMHFRMFQYNSSMAGEQLNFHNGSISVSDYIDDGTVKAYYATITLTYVIGGITYESEYYFYRNVR